MIPAPVQYRDRLLVKGKGGKKWWGNDINASSQLGLNCTININTPNLDPDSGLVALPEDLIDPNQQVAQACENYQESRFVATGRRGLPESPLQSVNSYQPWSDLRDISGISSVSSNVSSSVSPMFHSEFHSAVHPPTSTTEFTEVSNWQVNGQGQVELVATLPHQLDEVCPATCQRLRQS
ncbi:MAG: S-layer family protein [Oculatellaceae cyanobacterium Prado106]|nr:S-layer family protein [Oculatellaceae cyanobacterium Prado106]